MGCAARSSSLVLAALLPLAAACRGDPVTAPPATALVPGVPAAAHGPVAVSPALDLGTPTDGGPFGSLRAVAVNERGQIAVDASPSAPPPVALLWEDGAFRRLVPLGATPAPFASPAALNAQGVAAGLTFVAASPGGPTRQRAALFAGSAPVLLPDGPGDVTGSQAFGINDAGDVVGSRTTRLAGALFAVPRATLWRRGGAEVVDLGALVPGGSSLAFAVNNRGQAVGSSVVAGPGSGTSRPVFYGDGGLIALEVPPGYTGGFAYAVNERGQAAGQVTGPGVPSRAVLWDQNGQVALLPVPPGTQFSTARGINDAGDVVGGVRGGDVPGAPERTAEAAFWRGGALTILASSPRAPVAFPVAEAADVNNRGQVVGASTGPEGTTRAVRWAVSPAVPEPDVPLRAPNEPPAVVSLRPDPARGPYSIAAGACGGRYTVCVRFTVTETDGDTPYRVVVDWGDGTPWAPNELTRSGVPALAAHRDAAPGTYTVRVTATDRRAAASTATLTLTVVP